jgi:hypoxanthine phosphoribosyltransferase
MMAVPLQSKENLRLLISQEQIRQKVRETARQIELDYQGKDLVIVAVMKGAICLIADLIREINLPLTLESIQCSSYGAGGAERGELKILGLDRLSIRDKDVLIVDDIFDTGHTMQGLYHAFESLQARSIKSCVLLEKNVPHISELRPDYALFPIENLFVIGYGLDYKELYRGLPSIFVLTL